MTFFIPDSIQPLYAVGLLAIGATLLSLYKRFSRISISHVPGPAPESFVYDRSRLSHAPGNLPELFQSQAGVPDFKWQSQYGGVVRIKGAFGEDRLVISDPKAMQYIFQTSGYNFLKWPERTEISRVLMGRGLLWADGETHKRQRKVMLPGFGAPESKSFIPIFNKVASDLCAHWTDLVASSADQSVELNAASWLSRATMDSLGEAAFDYHFGALDQTENQLMKAYFGLMSDTLGQPSRKTILEQTLMPIWYLRLKSDYSNSKHLVHARHTANLASAIAKELIDMKSETLMQGRAGGKDVLSLLVKANASEDPATRLTEEEMIAQMRTLLLAGHETSATSLTWVLYELARHPEVQKKLREEIRATEARNKANFSANDFDSMPYMAAVLKESLRLHPAVYQNYRRAVKDDVLPLSKPIMTASGEVLNELPVGKGTKVVLSIAAYNRDKDVFGEDADVYNPDRWLRSSGEKKGPTVGVYGNLLTFAGAIINNFELAPTKDLSRLRREACLVMVSQHHAELGLAGSFQRPCRRFFVDTPKKQPSTSQDSIFSDTQSPWDHVFENVPPPSKLLPSTLRTPLSTKRPRRQKMTAREISAFDDMFNMIFDAVAEQKMGHGDKANLNVGIGGRGGLGDIFGKLRRHSKRVKWTTEEDELLDRKKEEMDLCDTDQQLLDWAMREVFGESEKMEETSRKAVEEGVLPKKAPTVQSPTYPHLLALLMKTFRDKYRDPHLALSIFNHARNLSIASYVFGCSTDVYNELIDTRWNCFRDLKGVYDALEEMSVNGVDFDDHTRSIVEKVRREVGERNLWIEEEDAGGNEAWSMLNKIEGLVNKAARKSRKARVKAEGSKPQRYNEWKAQDQKRDDDWEFDSWEKPERGFRR
ncbi:hypothetical protein AAF712_000532 [Marasmius tenuissimus]|uniref:Mtf2-like C-terminal domain-containing protein n=1 Tax=Marasmius tenuissimus TaxID=585030 RepID=A0ABR3AHH0_9AGAR